MNALEVNKVSMSFPGGTGRRVIVLDGVSLSVPAGRAVAISGSSGSGKTTLLNILGGLARPESGEVRWAGRSAYAGGREELTRWRREVVGFVFQSYQLMPELSARENILLPAAFRRRDAQPRADELLGQIGLGQRARHRPAELSGGEQQRVAIARALINHPAVILADEPTGNLDPASGGAALDLLLGLARERGTTLLLVTHDAAIARRMDLRYRLVGGKLEQDYENLH